MNKFLLTFLFFLTLFFAVHSSASAATRYVNADSSGAASNPTRAFNDPSYTANDSYQTFTAAYTAASAGDTIEFSGGTSGKTYIGHTGALSKQNLIIKGSSILGYNGQVTIDRNPGDSGNYTIGLNASGITLLNLTIQRTSGVTGGPLAIYQQNITVKNVTIHANPNASTLTIDLYSSSNNTLFQNCVIDHDRNSYVNSAIRLQANAGTVTFNNCTINGFNQPVANINTGSTANFVNSVLTVNGYSNSIFSGTNGGVANTDHCLIQGGTRAPHVFLDTVGYVITWNSTNDIINGFPWFERTKQNTGFYSLIIDDIDVDYFATLADYAKQTYDINLTMAVSQMSLISSADYPTLQRMCQDGHNIATHTRRHNDFSQLNGIKVTYSGSNTDMALVVSGSGTSLSTTGTSETHGPIDLTSAPDNTLGGLCSTISSWTHYACSLVTNINNGTLSTGLKDTTTALPQNILTNIPFDDNAGPTNRYYTEEITNSINDLESAIQPGCPDYTVETMAWPYEKSSAQALAWVKNNTSLIGVRGTSSIHYDDDRWLSSLDIYDYSQARSVSSIQGPNYSTLTDSEKQQRIEQAARVTATEASYGEVLHTFTHTAAADLTVQDVEWFLDELVKYRDYITIDSFLNITNQIRTSGLWTNSSGTTYTRSFTGSDDFRLKYQSPLINTGAVVAGRTTDILGNPIVGTPDMGAYEFQAPTAPTSLAQYKSNGTTAISSGAFTNETSVVLKFNMASINTSDSLTPEVEIQPIGTSFTDTVTNTGEAVAYSDTAVLGTVNVTGLTDGVTYHWQARISNIAGSSSWVAMGGNPDFMINKVKSSRRYRNQTDFLSSSVFINTPSTTTADVSTNPTVSSTISEPIVPPTTYSLGAVTLRKGSKGETVKELQRFLNDKLNSGLITDGKLGPKTVFAVKQWQKANGLTPDGLVGPKTKGKMLGRE